MQFYNNHIIAFTIKLIGSTERLNPSQQIIETEKCKMTGSDRQTSQLWYGTT